MDKNCVEQLMVNDLNTPSYVFNVDKVRSRLNYIMDEIGNIPITYSIKANPFIVTEIISQLSHVEACSPGELEICKMYGIRGEQIIYSGVNKEELDIFEAISYNVDIVTIESMLQAEYVQRIAGKQNRIQKIILRLSSGNQFGMSEEDMDYLIDNRTLFPNLCFFGVHFYSGTQKRRSQILEDFNRIENYLDKREQMYGFRPMLVEVGLGLPTYCFSDDSEEKEHRALTELHDRIEEFSQKYPLGIELGRYIASPSGIYISRVKDIKTCEGIHYVICDGGIHHLKYYGQTMAMQIPKLKVSSKSETTKRYCLCGSLCTVADVMVRDVELPELHCGDIIMFHECGAYSVTEAPSLFLSRDLPTIYLYSEKVGLKKVRNTLRTSTINCAHK